MNKINIQDKIIGEGYPAFIIAEIGMNHDGNFSLAKDLVKAAAEAGADAVKFQAHIAEAETLKNAPTPPYFKDEPRFDYFRRTAFDREQLRKLKEHAEASGTVFLCSPFSIEAADLLESISIAAYKIPSGEVTNLPYLQYIAKLGKPVILSSGMSSLAELEKAIVLIRENNEDIILLQCSSEYPCPYDSVGLNLIGEFRERFDLPVGLSDHTLTIYTAIAAVTLGACVIEKHFTLSKKMYGPDSKFSLVPEEFRQLVEGVRAVEAALANPVGKDDTSKYSQMKTTFQKSITSAMEIPRSTIIKAEMISLRKPGNGLQPERYNDVIGKKARRDISRDSLIYQEDIEW